MHTTSKVKDLAFVAHKIKGSYNQRAVGAVGDFRVQHTGVGTRTGLSIHISNAKDFAF
jgi:hypothetical protein